MPNNRYLSEVKIVGLDALLDSYKKAPDAAATAAQLALNSGARTARRLSADKILSQVNLGPDYFKGSKGDQRLAVRLAKQGELTSEVIARKRPTSLARYSLNRTVRRGQPVNVKIRNKIKTGAKVSGGSRSEAPFFLLKLRAGKADIESKFNLGLAVRLRKGEKLSGKYKLVKPLNPGKDNVVLLYAPSVDQVFQTVRFDVRNPVGAHMQAEFVRQFERLFDGR